MTTNFEVRVTLVLSARAAQVWREPDQEQPNGRAYGLLLSRVVDVDGQHVKVREGDILTAQVDEREPDKIILARFLKHGHRQIDQLVHA